MERGSRLPVFATSTPPPHRASPDTRSRGAEGKKPREKCPRPAAPPHGKLSGIDQQYKARDGNNGTLHTKDARTTAGNAGSQTSAAAAAADDDVVPAPDGCESSRDMVSPPEIGGQSVVEAITVTDRCGVAVKQKPSAADISMTRHTAAAAAASASSTRQPPPVPPRKQSQLSSTQGAVKSRHSSSESATSASSCTSPLPVSQQQQQQQQQMNTTSTHAKYKYSMARKRELKGVQEAHRGPSIYDTGDAKEAEGLYDSVDRCRSGCGSSVPSPKSRSVGSCGPAVKTPVCSRSKSPPVSRHNQSAMTDKAQRGAGSSHSSRTPWDSQRHPRDTDPATNCSAGAPYSEWSVATKTDSGDCGVSGGHYQANRDNIRVSRTSVNSKNKSKSLPGYMSSADMNRYADYDYTAGNDNDDYDCNKPSSKWLYNKTSPTSSYVFPTPAPKTTDGLSPALGRRYRAYSSPSCGIRMAQMRATQRQGGDAPPAFTRSLSHSDCDSVVLRMGYAPGKGEYPEILVNTIYQDPGVFSTIGEETDEHDYEEILELSATLPLKCSPDCPVRNIVPQPRKKSCPSHPPQLPLPPPPPLEDQDEPPPLPPPKDYTKDRPSQKSHVDITQNDSMSPPTESKKYTCEDSSAVTYQRLKHVTSSGGKKGSASPSDSHRNTYQQGGLSRLKPQSGHSRRHRSDTSTNTSHSSSTSRTDHASDSESGSECLHTIIPDSQPGATHPSGKQQPNDPLYDSTPVNTQTSSSIPSPEYTCSQSNNSKLSKIKIQTTSKSVGTMTPISALKTVALNKKNKSEASQYERLRGVCVGEQGSSPRLTGAHLRSGPGNYASGKQIAPPSPKTTPSATASKAAGRHSQRNFAALKANFRRDISNGVTDKVDDCLKAAKYELELSQQYAHKRPSDFRKNVDLTSNKSKAASSFRHTPTENSQNESESKRVVANTSTSVDDSDSISANYFSVGLPREMCHSNSISVQTDTLGCNPISQDSEQGINIPESPTKVLEHCARGATDRFSCGDGGNHSGAAQGAGESLYEPLYSGQKDRRSETSAQHSQPHRSRCLPKPQCISSGHASNSCLPQFSSSKSRPGSGRVRHSSGGPTPTSVSGSQEEKEGNQERRRSWRIASPEQSHEPQTHSNTTTCQQKDNTSHGNSADKSPEQLHITTEAHQGKNKDCSQVIKSKSTSRDSVNGTFRQSHKEGEGIQSAKHASLKPSKLMSPRLTRPNCSKPGEKISGQEPGKFASVAEVKSSAFRQQQHFSKSGISSNRKTKVNSKTTSSTETPCGKVEQLSVVRKLSSHDTRIRSPLVKKKNEKPQPQEPEYSIRQKKHPEHSSPEKILPPPASPDRPDFKEAKQEEKQDDENKSDAELMAEKMHPRLVKPYSALGRSQPFTGRFGFKNKENDGSSERETEQVNGRHGIGTRQTGTPSPSSHKSSQPQDSGIKRADGSGNQDGDAGIVQQQPRASSSKHGSHGNARKTQPGQLCPDKSALSSGKTKNQPDASRPVKQNDLMTGADRNISQGVSGGAHNWYREGSHSQGNDVPTSNGHGNQRTITNKHLLPEYQSYDTCEMEISDVTGTANNGTSAVIILGSGVAFPGYSCTPDQISIKENVYKGMQVPAINQEASLPALIHADMAARSNHHDNHSVNSEVSSDSVNSYEHNESHVNGTVLAIETSKHTLLETPIVPRKCINSKPSRDACVLNVAVENNYVMGTDAWTENWLPGDKSININTDTRYTTGSRTKLICDNENLNQLSLSKTNVDLILPGKDCVNTRDMLIVEGINREMSSSPMPSTDRGSWGDSQETVSTDTSSALINLKMSESGYDSWRSQSSSVTTCPNDELSDQEHRSRTWDRSYACHNNKHKRLSSGSSMSLDCKSHSPTCRDSDMEQHVDELDKNANAAGITKDSFIRSDSENTLTTILSSRRLENTLVEDIESDEDSSKIDQMAVLSYCDYEPGSQDDMADSHVQYGCRRSSSYESTNSTGSSISNVSSETSSSNSCMSSAHSSHDEIFNCGGSPSGMSIYAIPVTDVQKTSYGADNVLKSDSDETLLASSEPPVSADGSRSGSSSTSDLCREVNRVTAGRTGAGDNQAAGAITDSPEEFQAFMAPVTAPRDAPEDAIGRSSLPDGAAATGHKQYSDVFDSATTEWCQRLARRANQSNCSGHAVCGQMNEDLAVNGEGQAGMSLDPSQHPSHLDEYDEQVGRRDAHTGGVYQSQISTGVADVRSYWADRGVRAGRQGGSTEAATAPLVIADGSTGTCQAHNTSIHHKQSDSNPTHHKIPNTDQQAPVDAQRHLQDQYENLCDENLETFSGNRSCSSQSSDCQSSDSLPDGLHHDNYSLRDDARMALTRPSDLALPPLAPSMPHPQGPPSPTRSLSSPSLHEDDPLSSNLHRLAGSSFLYSQNSLHRSKATRSLNEPSEICHDETGLKESALSETSLHTLPTSPLAASPGRIPCDGEACNVYSDAEPELSEDQPGRDDIKKIVPERVGVRSGRYADGGVLGMAGNRRESQPNSGAVTPSTNTTHANGDYRAAVAAASAADVAGTATSAAEAAEKKQSDPHLTSRESSPDSAAGAGTTLQSPPGGAAAPSSADKSETKKYSLRFQQRSKMNKNGHLAKYLQTVSDSAEKTQQGKIQIQSIFQSDKHDKSPCDNSSDIINQEHEQNDVVPFEKSSHKRSNSTDTSSKNNSSGGLSNKPTLALQSRTRLPGKRTVLANNKPFKKDDKSVSPDRDSLTGGVKDKAPVSPARHVKASGTPQTLSFVKRQAQALQQQQHQQLQVRQDDATHPSPSASPVAAGKPAEKKVVPRKIPLPGRRSLTGGCSQPPNAKDQPVNRGNSCQTKNVQEGGIASRLGTARPSTNNEATCKTASQTSTATTSTTTETKVRKEYESETVSEINKQRTDTCPATNDVSENRSKTQIPCNSISGHGDEKSPKSGSRLPSRLTPPRKLASAKPAAVKGSRLATPADKGSSAGEAGQRLQQKPSSPIVSGLRRPSANCNKH